MFLEKLAVIISFLAPFGLISYYTIICDLLEIKDWSWCAWPELFLKMSEPELLLDSNIRLWVVLPIVFITFFVGMIRHYVSILLQSDKKLTQEQVSDR